MYLLQSWAESLAIFKPANLKLFLLVTLKNIIQTYKTLFGKFYLLLLGCFGFQIGVALFEEKYILLHKGTGFAFSSLIFVGFIYFLMYLCARPSTYIKNYEYVKHYIPHFFLSILFLLFVVGLAAIPTSFITKTNFEFLLTVFVIIFTPMLSFFMLFLLDAKPSLHNFFAAIWRSFLMLIYNLPFCLICKLIMIGIMWLWTSMLLKFNIFRFSLLTVEILNLIFELAKVIPICIFTVFYTKRLHEQFDLYFSSKGQ